MKKNQSLGKSSIGMTRRSAVRLTTSGLIATGVGILNLPAEASRQQKSDYEIINPKSTDDNKNHLNMKNKVQYEEMFPEELEAVLKEFPVAYVPFGSLEWHGRHMPYGVDSLKAHGILIYTAQKYGGVVLPPTYWGHMGQWKIGNHPGLSADLVDRLFIEIFTGLVRVGFRAIIGVTGHDVKPQVNSLQKAVDAISAFTISPEGRTIGFAMMEGSLNPEDTDVGMDHAAKWETSIMLALRSELVDMKRIENVERTMIESGTGINSEGCGISGLDPRIHASIEVGNKAIQKIGEKIGQKAQELLKSVNWRP